MRVNVFRDIFYSLLFVLFFVSFLACIHVGSEISLLNKLTITIVQKIKLEFGIVSLKVASYRNIVLSLSFRMHRYVKTLKYNEKLSPVR